MAASWALWLAVQAAPPAKPVEPVTGILEAFRTHSIVALAEGDHGNEQAHAFRLSLIRDSRFPTLVNDVVVEFGSARYQEVMDRFVRGDAVPGETLRQGGKTPRSRRPSGTCRSTRSSSVQSER
jgi:hypothetical protein